MIKITQEISIDDKEIQIRFIRASGPGGQKVNKVATAAQLRFDVGNSSLNKEIHERLFKLAGRKATKEGVIVLHARRFRTQERNRQDVIERLAILIRRALIKPKPRRKTKPSRKVKEKRLADKKRQSEKKRLRRSPD